MFTQIAGMSRAIVCKNCLYNQALVGNRLRATFVIVLPNKRDYSIGEYDKLWQSVTSGKGKRGAKKKTAVQEVHGDFIKFGKANIAFPGLNAPISASAADKRSQQEASENERHGFVKKRAIDASRRGWSGTTWPGRHAGAPETPNKERIQEFDSIVIEVKKVSVTKGNGRRKRSSAVVVVGNRKGSIGWAIGKASFASAAIRKARNKAVNYLHHVPLHEDNTVYHNLSTKVKSTTVKFEKKVPGYGLRCQRIVRAIAELAGIENLRCKLVGRTTPLTVVRAAFQGLALQETHRDLAERTGKYVVEFRPEKRNHPVVVATPTEQAVYRRLNNSKIFDVTEFFDPYLGVHAPKSVEEIRGQPQDFDH